MDEIQQNADADVIKYLVGNFADMEDEREVTREEALTLMNNLGFSNYIETSALNGQNVNPLFETITKHLFILNEHKLEQFVSTSARAASRLPQATFVVTAMFLISFSSFNFTIC